jgi:hypothetical protein
VAAAVFLLVAVPGAEATILSEDFRPCPTAEPCTETRKVVAPRGQGGGPQLRHIAPAGLTVVGLVGLGLLGYAWRRRIRSLALLGRDKRLVGIVWLGDLAVETGNRQLSGAVLQEVSQPN